MAGFESKDDGCDKLTLVRHNKDDDGEEKTLDKWIGYYDDLFHHLKRVESTEGCETEGSKQKKYEITRDMRGCYQGEYKTWHGNGNLCEIGQCINDLRDGEWNEYYPSGYRKSQKFYKNGIHVGTWKGWWDILFNLEEENHVCNDQGQSKEALYATGFQKYIHNYNDRGQMDGREIGYRNFVEYNLDNPDGFKPVVHYERWYKDGQLV